jgi:hypothetical protein
MRSFVLVAMTFASTVAQADDAECNRRIGADSVCEVATKLAREMATRLPMKLNEQVSLNAAHSNKNVLTVTGAFSFDRETARSFFEKNNITLEQFENTYSAKVRPNLCKPGSTTEEFIKSGGIVSYTYNYRDGTQFMKFGVKSCD